METTMVIVWAAGLSLYLVLRALLVLARLIYRPIFWRHLRRQHRQWQMAQSQVRLSHDRPQIKSRPPILPPSRNGRKPYSRSLRRVR